MNLKLSTSAALALDAITKAGGSRADAGDSKVILTDKIASSYQQDAIAINGVIGKRMLQHVRKLQARVKKNDVGNPPSTAAEHEKSTTIIDHRVLPDVGILRRGMSTTSPKDSNRQQKPFRKVAKKYMDNNPDVGILGMRKDKEGEQRRTSSHVLRQGLDQGQGELLPDIDPSIFDINGTIPNVTEWFPEIYELYPVITSTPTYLCGENGLGGTDPYSMSSSNQSTSPLDNLPTCQCQPEQTPSCGPDLCTCLQNSQGDIKSCMNEVTTLCEGQDSSLTMGQCVGQEILSSTYCTYLPCIVDGGSYEKCFCDTLEQYCSTTSNPLYVAFLCPFADCCKTQTDDAGRATCFDFSGSGFTNYYNYTVPTSALYEEFEECVSNPTNTAAQCACDAYAPSLCRLYGDAYPVYCNIETCCQTQMDDAGRLDCWGNNAYCECMSGMGLGNNTRYKCLCQASSIRCEFGEQQQCEVYSCCTGSMFELDDTKVKACLGIDNSTAVETVTCPYIGSTSSSAESNLSTNDSNSSTKPSPGAVDTTTTETLPAPAPPTTNPTVVLGTPAPSAAAELPISTIKTFTMSMVVIYGLETLYMSM